MGAESLLIISAFAKLGSSVSQAQALREQGKFRAQQLGFRRRLSELESEAAFERGNFEAQAIAQRARELIGAQRAGFAGQGVDIGVGVPVALRQQAEYISELDILEARNNAWMKAWGFRTEARQIGIQAKFARRAAEFAARQTLLSGTLGFAEDVMSFSGGKRRA